MRRRDMRERGERQEGEDGGDDEGVFRSEGNEIMVWEGWGRWRRRRRGLVGERVGAVCFLGMLCD